jgi:3-oxoacyl-[acyl-carrier protein] reductase
MPAFLITGAASGIGRAFARAMLAQGAQVLAADIDEAGLAQAVPDSPNLIRRRLDVRRADEWTDALAHTERAFGGVDVLCNIAGVLTPGLSDAFALHDVDAHIDINVKGAIYGTRIIGAAMAARGRGHIVNIASLAGIAPVPGLALYAASKFAVRGFSLTAALDLRPKGVYVTVVCPDLVDTPMLETQLHADETAITFSGSAQPLSVDDAVRVLQRALRDKPVELTYPAHRGATAKLVGAMPALALKLIGVFTGKGRRQQLALRAARKARS